MQLEVISPPPHDRSGSARDPRQVSKNDAAVTFARNLAVQRGRGKMLLRAAGLAIFLYACPASSGIFRPRDFAANSPWNTPISGAAIMVAAEGAAGTDVGLDTWLDNNAWTIPCYRAAATDAPRRLLYSPDAWRMVAAGRWRRAGNPPRIEAAILASAHSEFPFVGHVFSTISSAVWRLPPWLASRAAPRNLRYRFTSAMHPASGSDGHMATAQPDGFVVETYATIVLSSGDVVALSASVTDPAGLGDGHENGQTASMLPDYAGLIEDDEIATGIRHAMAITIPPALLAPAIAYPAASFDRDAMTEARPYAGTIPMGARLALPATLDLASLALRTQSGRAIAWAARTYGFIVVDRGGGGITLRVRPNAAHPRPELHAWNTDLQADLRAIFSQVKRVPVAAAPG
jgi:hypothetical protein